MAKRIIDARVRQKAAPLEEWNNSDLDSLDGEQLFVRSDVDDAVIGFKLGAKNKKFSELPYPDFTVRGKVSTTSTWTGRQSGIYIPTTNGNYNGVQVNLTEGYQVLYWDGSTVEKVVYPNDYVGVVFGGVIDDTYDLSNPTEPIWYIASPGTYNTVPSITLTENSILTWNGQSWSHIPFELEVRGEFLVADNIQEVRNITPDVASLLVNGTYKGVTVLGYYEPNDTPAAINYYVSDTLLPDDGGSVLEVGGIKLEHVFREVDLRYYGAIENEDVVNVFERASINNYNVIIDNSYKYSSTININKSDFTLNITKNGSLFNDINRDGNAIYVNPSVQNVIIKGGGSVVGNTDQSTVGYGIAVGANSNKIVINNINISGFTGGIIFNRNNKDIKINSCSFYDMTFVPSVNAGGYGIVLQESYDTIIDGNYFDETVERHHVYYAIHTILTENPGENHVLSNNVFKSKTLSTYSTGFEYAVKIMASKNVTCIGNVFTGGVGSIWFTSYSPLDGSDTKIIHCSNINIIGNCITGVRKGNSEYSSAIGSHGKYTKTTNVNISNNTIIDCQTSKGDIDLNRVVDCSINSNNISGHSGTLSGINIDITAINLSVVSNNIKGHQRGINITKNSSVDEDKPYNIIISSNNISSVNFNLVALYPELISIIKVNSNILNVINNSCVRIDSDVLDLSISNNHLTTLGESSLINLTSNHKKDCYIHDNIYKSSVNRSLAIRNDGTGLVFTPINDKNVSYTASDVPSDSSRFWVSGDIVRPTSNLNSEWVRVTNGTNNVKGTDWVLRRPLATTSTYGVVRQAASIPSGSTSDQIISALKSSGLMAT